MNTSSHPEAGRPRESFPIVVIGASAGGKAALGRFLSVLPDSFDFALVFMEPPSPGEDGLVPGVPFAGNQGIRVDRIGEGLPILPGHLYLCSPSDEVRIDNGTFRIPSRLKPHTHFPVDELLVAFSQDAPDRVVAVILSGEGTDGARGVRAVRKAGGTVFAQDPATAEHPDMPLAAIDTGQTDGVLAPDHMAREILKLFQSGMGAPFPEQFVTTAQFDSLFRLVSDRTGLHFDHYKRTVVARRVRRRMYLHGIPTVDGYLEFLMARDGEASLLAGDLMIGVTSFFRDRLAWKALHLEATRRLVASEEESPIRVWAPACATGEEAYSIAMMLVRELELAGKRREVQVFATDINDAALERARIGTYPATVAADIAPEYLTRYLTLDEEGLFFTVNKEIRQLVVFARQDLLADPPFSRLDIVVCRNLLIYIEPEAQERCIAIFHYALRKGGFLFLGNAESPGRNNTLFVSLNHKKCRIYRKSDAPAAARIPLSIPYVYERSTLPTKRRSTEEHAQSITQFIQEALLDAHAPAAVAINQSHDILYHSGPTNRYLRQPRGTPTHNFMELLPGKLRNRVRAGLFRAAQESKPVTIRTSIADDHSRKREVAIQVLSLKENLFLITFTEKGRPPDEAEAVSLDAAVIEETAVRQLENELTVTRDDLQSHIEQLRSLNEELESSNEELQAANEELETSREELQSLNEELATVNTQLQTKIEEQEETNNDLNNFLTSTNMPTVFLDRGFRVKLFTPAMSRLVKLIPADVGRPIIDMSQENLGPDLIADARSVLDRLTPATREIPIDGAWYVRTALPYRTADNRIEGVVITYTDITERKQAEEQTRHLASFPRLNPNPILEITIEGRAAFLNPAAIKVLEVLGKAKEDYRALLPQDLGALLTEWDRKTPETLSREVATEGRVFDEAIQLVPEFGAARVYARDITLRKRVEEALKESEERVRLKLESILAPEGDIGDLELADIIDIEAMQALMDDFYALARFPMSVIDLKGTMLVGKGWQDICTKFHRAHPETCRHCVESDTQLSRGVAQGEFKLYRCKNNMWDIATPIMVGGLHVGNVFSGQFFFEDEALDYDLFRAQARQYGFSEEEYIAALEAVPRLSREKVETGMSFLMRLSHMLSKLSYSNIKLARSLAQGDALTKSLREREEELQSTLERFYTILASMYAAILIVTDDGHVEFANQAFCDYFDLDEPPEALKGVGSADMLEKIGPAYANPDEAITRIREIVREGKPVQDEEVASSGGRTRLRDFVPIRVEGKPSGRIWYHLDITARKRAEQNLTRAKEEWERTFAGVPDLIAILDKDHRVVRVNPAMAERLGVPADRCVGLPCYRAVHGLDGPPEFCPHSRTIKDGEQHVEGVHEERLGGDFEVSTTPIYDKEGNMVGSVHVAHDVTDRRRAEEALKKAHGALEHRVRERTAELAEAYERLRAEVEERKRAEEHLRHAHKMEAIGTLAGGIAHDFNNILASILGFTELAMDDAIDRPEIEKTLRHVLKSAHRGKDLIKQILTFSRKADQPRSLMAITPVIEETVHFLRASIPSTVEIRFHKKASFDTVVSSPVEIQQILMNLATNAAFAMQEKGGTLEITMRNLKVASGGPSPDPGLAPGKYIELAVKDTGTGMSPETVKRIFEPFFTTREVGKGTGMGLAVVYGIVQGLNGAVTVESEPGVGSLFRVFIPHEETELRDEPVETEDTLNGTERVLFIDDEEMIAEWGEASLARLGYAVTSVTESDGALALFSRDPGKFDLVITDQTMPGMTGMQLAGALFTIRPDIPIILCTGHSETVTPEAARALGIASFLMKPLTRDELAAAVRAVFDARAGK